MIQIKRYQNRKLYNYNIKSYVTLGDILILVQDGTLFRVTDWAGVDITSRTVMKAIIERNSFDSDMVSYNANYIREKVRRIG